MQENLLECFSLMTEVAIDGFDSTMETLPSPDTPVTVLRGASYLSGWESAPTIGSNSDGRDVKKSKTATADDSSDLGSKPK